MKKITPSIKFSCIMLFIFYNASAQWATVGSSNFANGGAGYIFSAVAPNGEPYVVYKENSIASGRVKKFNGSNWVDVGANFSTGEVSSTTMTFDKYGMPCVAYTDWANGGKATVMKFDGNNWVAIGNADFTLSDATYISFVLDSNGIPYVAFRDFANAYRASVMKFDGTNWVYVGLPGFSSNASFGGVADISLAIDASGTLYISYVDHSPTYKATVMKFDGNNWVNVGAGIISAGQSGYTSIVIDSQGAPYVAYEDGANGGKTTVMKFDGSNWLSVGIAGFSPGVAQYTSLAIDKNNVLYLAFEDHTQSDRASVMTYNGNAWEYVGTAGFSDSVAMYTTIAIDKNNGILYTAYEDLYNGTTLYPTYNATVMKFENAVNRIKEIESNSSLNVFPNPASSVIQINYTTIQKNNAQLNITNAKGQSVYKETFKGNYNKEIDLSKYSRGVYFIEIVADKKRTQRKIILD